VHRARKPARTYITFAHSVVDESGTGLMTYHLPYPEPAPGIADELNARGPIVDVMAIDIGVPKPLIPLPFERERRWLITMLALPEGDAMYAAMDAAQETLREDLYAGRILPGAHPGSVTPSRSTPAETALREFREQTMAEMEREEQKRRAGRLKAIGRRGRRWRWV
jgi:hypothetical protein